MNKIYLVLLVGALVCGAYFYGANITNVKCHNEIAQNNLVEIQETQKNKREIHEIVYKTGTIDIRRILCDKYTIAE